jgi:hypothetical protein
VGRTESEIEELMHRVMSFGHQTLVIQIPRYLSYLVSFIEKEGASAAANISRNALFEYFIYSKLDLEDKRFHTQKRLLIKRVLEKLALTMEIYQTNVLSKDELMTFLDELDSDLTLVALSQWKLDTFYQASLLKDGIETIEFDNAEFQEYLAAKEVTRLPDVSKAAFTFAADAELGEIYPSWFNALTFLVDMHQELLEQLVEFAGLRADEYKVVDPSFFTFLSRVRTSAFPVEVRRRVFKDCVSYHERNLQWLPARLGGALASYYDASLEDFLKAGAESARVKAGARRFVPLTNTGYLVGNLVSQGIDVDRPYWRERLVRYATDSNKVLQRSALFALGEFGDPVVLDLLPDLTGGDELVERAFLNMCAHLEPNHPKARQYFVAAMKKGRWEGRQGIAMMTTSESLQSFLREFVDDGGLRESFLEQSSYSDEEDEELVGRIASVLNSDMRELAKLALLASIDFEIGHDLSRSPFLTGLWRLLQADDPTFVSEMVGRINALPQGRGGFHLVTGLIAETINERDVVPYVKALQAIGEEFAALDTMLRVKRSERPDRDVVYESARGLLFQEYADWEARLQRSGGEAHRKAQELMDEFTQHLEPEPGKFSGSLFRFYKENAERLEPLIKKEHKRRLTDLIENTVFKFVDPATHRLTITENIAGAKTYTVTNAVRMFGDALLISEQLGINVAPYRQKILNFVPFAFGDELKAIFRLARNIQPGEFRPVLDVYKAKTSDLWKHQPSNLVEAVEQYHVVQAAPMLREFVYEGVFDRYPRRRALVVAESLAPNAEFLRDVMAKYASSHSADERNLAEVANGLLITVYGDSNAIKWRFKQIKTRVRKEAGRSESDADRADELHEKSFARPLMELKHLGFEFDYLGLIDDAMALWSKGELFHSYGAYLWDITYAYFDNLKAAGSYAPLQMVEDKVLAIKEKEGANWVASRMASLRRSYLSYLGKPRNISAAVQIHNEARNYDDKKIRNSSDLFRQLQNVLEVDLRRWIEGEGAYELIRGDKVYSAKKQEYEKLIQKTIKAQLENIILKKGFQVDIFREAQLLDEKRTDFLVRYGFVGPIVVEIKLTSNADLRAKRIERSPSYASMKRYMGGYGASHGILLVIDNREASNVLSIKKAFQTLPNVWVQSFECKPPTKIARGRSGVSGSTRRKAKKKP